MIYHIALPPCWQAAIADGVYTPPGFAADGFIHCCTAEQIAGVIDRYFRGEANLLVLSIDPQAVAAEIRWEDLTGSGVAYPHIYGPLDVAAVQAALPFSPEPDDVFMPPSQLWPVSDRASTPDLQNEA
jgi:uncharacterized protein (DUF952 family)